MKKVFLFICIIISIKSVAQADTTKQSIKQVQSSPEQSFSNEFYGLKYWLPYGETVYCSGGEKSIWTKRLKFKIIDEIGDTIYIKIKPIFFDPINMKGIEISNNDTATAYYKIRNKKGGTGYYNQNPRYQSYINQSNYDSTQYYLLKGAKRSYVYGYKAITTGILTLPIKIRFPVDSFPIQASADISVGPYIGLQWGQKNYSNQKEQTKSTTLAFFVAPGMVNANSSNSKNNAELNTTAFALSFGLGVLKEVNRFQYGIFTGFDMLFGDQAKTWIYQPFVGNKNIPWISIAIGYTFRKD